MESYLAHHGVKGQKWGVKNGPPYPIGSSPRKVFISGTWRISEKGSPYERSSLPKEITNKVDSYMKDNCHILIGDAPGIDTKVQNYLANKGYKNVTVYTISDKPRQYSDKDGKLGWGIKNVKGSEQVDKDKAMSKDAHMGFAVILEEGSKATRNNIERMDQDGKDVEVFQLNPTGIDTWVKTNDVPNDTFYIDKSKKFTRWSNSKELDIRQGAYMSYRRHDVGYYKYDAASGKLWSKETEKLFRTNISAIDDVKVRSGEAVINDLITKLGNHRIPSYHKMLTDAGYYSASVNDRYDMFSKDKKIALARAKVAKELSSYIKDHREDVSETYKKMGYDAITDPEDIVWNYELPMIITDPDKFSISSIKEYDVKNVISTSIADDIKNYVNEKKKDPVGNQNCMLCTWSAEQRLRGNWMQPRAVHSPRDPIFNLDPKKIVKNPKVYENINIKSIKDILKKAGDGARFYTHVNWEGGKGGHEFLLINRNNRIYVLDGQAGVYTPIYTKYGKEYFSNINSDNSYTFRIDNKRLNSEYLQYNNDKYYIPWDEAVDVEYMRRHNML